jgi:hypothetical protein
MSLIACPECGRMVSERAEACPQCGCPHSSGSVPLAEPFEPVPPPSPSRAAFTTGFEGLPARSSRRFALSVGVPLLGLVALALVVAMFGLGVNFGAKQTLIADRVDLLEGQSKHWPVHLAARRRVLVTVDAEPRPVNVVVLDAEQWQEYTRSHSNPSGQSGHVYTTGLSDLGTVHMDKTATLPAGDWHVVIERPREAPGSAQATVVRVAIIGY